MLHVPLDASVRAFMEPRFGHDFSRVRVHTNERAADSARAVNALAYTANPQLIGDTHSALQRAEDSDGPFLVKSSRRRV